ncbi:MAG: creatininase family protein [Promethearchaeota archaeon]
MTTKVLYTELNPQEFEERLLKAPIAYLPLGTLEWHGRHMPLGADGLISSGFFIELAKKIGGIVLPMLFLGPDSFKKVQNKDIMAWTFFQKELKKIKKREYFL